MFGRIIVLIQTWATRFHYAGVFWNSELYTDVFYDGILFYLVDNYIDTFKIST
jgi:hypothetical protein